MKEVIGTYSVSTKMYNDFEEELKRENKGGSQLFASRLLYDMMIDHNNAMLFGFNYSLIRDE